MYNVRPPEHRFNRMFKVDPDTNCHVWTAAKSKSGYGKFKVRDVDWRAHRWAFQHTNGEIPSGLQIDHLCNNRACVNVEHMRLATPGENSRAFHSKASARVNLDKTQCPRGHDLVPANIPEYSKKRGERVCKACGWAKARGKYAGRPAGWWLDEADRLYGELVSA